MVRLRETPLAVPEWPLPSTPFQLTTVLVYGGRAGVGRFVVVRLWGLQCSVLWAGLGCRRVERDSKLPLQSRSPGMTEVECLPPVRQMQTAWACDEFYLFGETNLSTVVCSKSCVLYPSQSKPDPVLFWPRRRNMLKFLTHKLRTHSLNEDQPHQDKVGCLDYVIKLSFFPCHLSWRSYQGPGWLAGAA